MAGNGRLTPLLIFLFLFFTATQQNTRNKRQISPGQPRLITQDGHLIFQTGANHNITFRSAAGGYINVDGDDIKVLTQTVKDNKQAIQELKTTPTGIPPNIESRLSNVEDQLSNLQASGEVLTRLNSLNDRISNLETNVPSNIDNRITAVENRLDNLTPTGPLQTTLNDILSRVTTLETRVTTVESQGQDEIDNIQEETNGLPRNLRRSLRRYSRRVRSVRRRVDTMQNLLSQDECSSNPCRNGGTCLDLYDGFHCSCMAAWEGATCEMDVNECGMYAGTDLGCQNGATCVNTVGSFTCQCTTNWHGIRCTERHDDCSGASVQELCGQGTCVNLDRVQPGQPKYTCICNDGWTNTDDNPACTVDKDECSQVAAPCSTDPPVQCLNYPGGFSCGQCPTGYSGNGFTCIDINECENNNGGCSMSPRVDCINTRGSRECGPCPSGFQGDGVTCTWVGVCNINNGGCHPQATCQESPGVSGRTCTCHPGYVGNGEGSTGCVAQGSSDGPCASNPCINGAVCQVVGSTYRCDCQPGYTGTNCEINTDECASGPCQNGGTCTDRVNGYVCTCTDSYTGTNCEEQQQSCGGVLNGESGSIRYPQDDTNYPHNVDCNWRIITTPGKIVMATFSQFNLEAHPNCNFDSLQIYDGNSASAHRIGSYCGTSLPNGGSINTTQHQMYLWFQSDVSVSDDGFQMDWVAAVPVCGGHLSGQDHGVIRSPGYPGNYPHNRDCIWTVTVSPGNNIMITFAEIAIENHPNCSYDYLEVRDGFTETSPLLQRYCTSANVVPAPISTTSPYAYIKFHTDASLNDRGFQLTYAATSAGPQCGGTLTDSDGVLTSPNYPNPYNHDASCVWTITVAVGDVITLTFTNMDIESHISCAYDYVEVRDGPDENAAIFNKYCGTTLPAPLTSSGNSMYVRFQSDSSQAGQGFRATWATACGGQFTEPEGTLQSPAFPNAYPANKECIYTISQPAGMTITLTFNAFDVEGSTNCAFDYAIVYDGDSDDSPVLGRFCGTQIPPPQTSTQNTMRLKFVTDGSVHNTGFQASYTSEDASCGGVLTDTSGSITSPGHPNVYPSGVNCTWQIFVSAGLVVRLSFNTFSLEQDTNCRNDYIAIYDNSTATSASLLGRYCGSGMPPSVTSSDNVMTVLFISDSSIAHEGFSASYVTINASTLCGRDLTSSYGVISSPNYPNPYPHFRECTWTITAPDRNQILLNVTDFSMEHHPNCNYDYLEIRNGGYDNSPLIGRYCGTTIDPIITSHSNRLWIRFRTDYSVDGRGFQLSYDSTSSGCGADLTTPTGSLISPNYPNVYTHNAECFWTITVSRGSTIQLTFTDFDVEHHSSCYYDYLEIRENGANGRLLAKYCGTEIPPPVNSTSNKLWLKYRTDYSIAGRGFHAAYASNCNNVLTSYSGVIESPNFPKPYPHNRNCTWIIDTTMGNTINASFSHFDVESHSNCRYDYLEIRDGQNDQASVLGKYCGTTVPPTIATSGEYMWIHFVSDYSVAQNGFRMEYVTDGCGGYFAGSTGEFTSPNYPQPYPHRRECDWVISVATGYSVQLTIVDFDLESHSSCSYDVLEIYGGPDATGPQLARICNKMSNNLTTTSGNMMYVRFKSDFSVNGRGFRATYTSVPGGCGGNFTLPSGVLVSKNYPEDYPHSTDCEWLITVAEGRSIILTFQDFDVEGTFDCRYDYVAVFDGPTRNSTVITTLCGDSLPNPSVYRSLGNQMYVRMRTDHSVSGRGFKAQYITGCGGDLSAEQDGIVTSPNYPENYDMQNNCSWLIRGSDSSDRITLTFTDMRIEEHSECNHDSVSVFNGDDDQAPLIGKYCGSTVPAPMTSQGSAMFVQFVSDSSIQQRGFRALYTTSISSCGGNFTAERGSFTSPGYPNNYPVNTECVWTVAAPPGNKVMIAFSVFDLEYHANCNYDYLELRERDVHGRLIGRFCGSALPSNLTMAEGLWMKFRSDVSSSAVGFLAEYSTAYGGELTGTSGQIASPAYPGLYPHNVDYVWTIMVQTGMRIRVTFVMIDIEAYDCVYDYIRFLDGADADSPELKKFCGMTLPLPFMSTTNVMRVHFHSDYSSTGQGFLFNWEQTNDQLPTTPATTASTTPIPGCGSDVPLLATTTPSTLNSPGFPNGYAHNLNCFWGIATQQGQKVWLNITYIDLEGHSFCQYDGITVYDGPTSSGRVLGHYCGRTANEAPLLSTTNEMSVRFKSDFSVNMTGFSLEYKAVCGDVMRMQSGVISSPNYGAMAYNNNDNCTWIVLVTTGRTVQVTFNQTFNVVGSPGSCQGDYVQLLNGGNQASPPINGTAADGKYCGNTPPAVMETNSNLLFVNFISDGASTAAGFSLTFREVQVACGGSILLTSQLTSSTIMSPNYPEVYPHNVDCTWIITVPASETVQVDFSEDFNIEAHPSCNFDFIELRDGGTANALLLGSYCGTTRPSTVKTTGNVLYARFRTDNSVPRLGFQATVQIAQCGGTIIGQSGIITSPNFPSNYDSNSDCVWFLRGPVGHYLTLTFPSFGLESSANCSLDFVEIRDINATGPLLTRSCGFSAPDPILTSDSFAYVRFKANNMNNFQGFKLQFDAGVEVCGGDLTTDVGSFTSPNFPGQYPHSRVCTWNIKVQQGRRVTLTFDQFNLESHINCNYDSVSVYNGILDDSPRIDRYCGDSPPSIVESSGNTMKVQFITDGSISNGGFQAHYSSQNEQKCGGLITGGLGNISSPGYANGNYSNNEECIWILSNHNQTSSSMFLTFVNFKLESHAGCAYDVVEIREGNNENGDLVGRYCGNTTLPTPVFVPTPNLWIRFKTDHSIVDRGFFLGFLYTDCGGVLTADNGELTSPNFPNNYNHSDACAWMIESPEGSQIKVEFHNFSIENHPNCNYDYVDILNGPYPSSPSVGPFCGVNLPSPFTSQSNVIRIIFKSDFLVARTGFKLTYSFVTGGCGGDFHGDSGRLSSPNYPRSYPHNVECIWNINVDSGYHVVLTFIPPFDLESHDNCVYDYVEVSEPLANDTLVPRGRWCGNLTPPQVNATGERSVVKFRSDVNTNGNGFAANWTAGCGAIFTEDSGTFISPGYPGKYANDLRCNYTISVDPERFVVLEFSSLNFELEGGAGCPYDYLHIFEGNDTSGRPLGKFCGSNVPTAVSSLGNMFIQFVTDRTLVFNGFRARYGVSDCGGVFTDAQGTISTPTNPTDYHHNINCTWFITVAENRVIDLRFISFDIEVHPNCRYDYVDVRDGGNLTAPLLGRFCGDVKPSIQRSSGNQMIVNFVTDFSRAGKGFTALYHTTYGQAQGCGGVLNATSGRITAVDIDNDGQYENRQDCKWTIIGGDNKIIKLTVEGMNIENHGSCFYDYILIHDGLSEEDPLIGKYCGNQPPPPIRSVSNALYVRFVSDSLITGAGFNISYVQEDALCGGAYLAIDDPGTITSPSYPNPVNQAYRCRWTVEAPEDERVLLTIINVNLQTDQNCTNEYLELKDYPLGWTGRTFHYCGMIVPPPFVSTGRKVQVNFAIQPTTGSTGFSLKFQMASCNMTYNGSNGQIYSPGWPGNYKINTYCQFSISAPEGTYISLYFNAFHIEHHPNCNYDYLMIRNGSTSDAPIIQKLCGTALPDPIFATGNSLWMAFATDISVTFPGYDITWTATSQGIGCGGNITGINGSLTSPGYPGNYTERHTCRWLITVPLRRHVRIQFMNIQSTSTEGCNGAYVEVFNGGSETSSFGQYCGNEIPAALVGTSNKALVKLVSDGVHSAPRFRLTFTS